MPQVDPGIKEFFGVSFRSAAESRNVGRLAKTTHKLYSFVDGFVGECQKGVPNVACREGCSACCHRLVTAALPEVLTAVQHITQNWTSEDREAFQKRALKSEIENGPFWRDELMEARAACPFLVEDRCSIYAIRPVACRGASSVNAATCRSFYLEGDLTEPTEVMDQASVNAFGSIAGEGCQRGSIVSGLFDFGATVARLLDNPGMVSDLDGPITDWEKTKLFSERTTRSDMGSPGAAETFAQPQIRPLVDLARLGQAKAIRERLPSQGRGIAEAYLGMTLPGQYESQDELEEWWAGLQDAVAQFEDLKGDPGLIFDCLHYFNAFNWAYAGKDVRPTMERLMRVVHRHATVAYPNLIESIAGPRKSGKFRLGYVSPRLKAFNGSRWALSAMRQHGSEIETYAFHLGGEEDSTSLAFRRTADHYAHLPWRLEAAASLIRSLDLDALIFTDIGMCGRSLQLASLQLARLQLNAWGHPVTSGSPTMDGYLSSALMEPDSGDRHYSEKLIRLAGNGLSTSYRPAIPSNRSALCLGVPETGFLLYCHVPNKHIPLHDPLFLRVIESSKIPVVFIGALTEDEKAPLRRRLRDRNTIFLDTLSRPDYLRLIQLADAAIESPAFGGGFTATDCLSVGTPLITLPGEFMRGRLSMGYLAVCGLGGFVAEDEDDYVDLALNRDRRQELVKGFDGASLFENAKAVAQLDALLLESRLP